MNLENKTFSVPGNWLKLSVLDMHTEGEPLRLILEGFPELPGDTILEKRRYAMENYDYLRTTLMWEPRGHSDMYGCLMVPAVSPEADFGVLFLHNEGFSTMCGHGIIAVTKAVLELGMFPCNEPLTKLCIDTPAGRITSYARVQENRVTSVYFHNVPSFVVTLNDTVDIPPFGDITYDLAFGGAFYAYVQADDLALSCSPENFRQIIDVGMSIKNEIMKRKLTVHPFDRDLNFLYGTIFICDQKNGSSHTKNVCVFAEGEVDRSPTGTGVSGRLAILYQRNQIKLNQSMTFESIIGSRFSGRVIKEVKYGPYQAVIPEVEGTSYITGMNNFYIDPEDPLKYGFLLR